MSIPFSDLSLPTQRKLRETFLRITAGASFNRFWCDLLSDDERSRLGNDPDFVFRQQNPAQIMCQLRGYSPLGAVIELGYRLEFLSTAGRDGLLKEIGESIDDSDDVAKPRWDVDHRELRYLNRVIRRFRSLKIAKNVAEILAIFEKNGWPTSIPNPLTDGPQQLHDAIKTLNRDISAIRFHVDDNSIVWAGDHSTV